MIKKYTPIIIELDLAYMKGDNLMLRAVKWMKNDYSDKGKVKNINIKSNDKLIDIENKIRYVFFRYEFIDRQRYMANIKSQLSHKEGFKRSYKQWKKAYKRGYNFLNENAVCNDIIFGYRRASERLGMSRSSFKKFLDWMVNNGHIKSYKEHKKIIAKMPKYAFDMLNNTTKLYRFVSNGLVYSHYGTRIVLV
jgi:hypothetical protein